jgi:Zn-dependent protease with chaperone function
VKFEPRLPADDVNVSARHPFKEGVVMVVGVVVAVALLLAVATFLVDRLVPYVPPSWEASVFPDFGAMRHTPGDDAEQAHQAKLEELFERLLVHWPEHPVSLQVGLLESSQPNALAFPGGLVLVTTGLMDRVDSENELAFVLGHELGHYRGRDHLRSLGRGLALTLILTAMGQSGTMSELVGISGQLTTRSFSREQESQADAFGLMLVEAEFGHVEGATDFFDELPAPESELERTLASYLATHPLTEDRVEAMEELAEERGWATEGETTPMNPSR